MGRCVGPAARPATFGGAHVTSLLNQQAAEGSVRTIVSIAASAAVVAAASVPLNASWAASDAECQDMWKKADTNADGVLADNESMRYVALMRVGNRTVAAEGRITQTEFMDACKNDLFAPHKAETGAPLKGANSFTEGQAKDRAIGHGGVDSVSGLKKDDDGIWRGKATRDGKPVEIAIDYKGNVVTTAQQ
jgi:hypothetical protein